MLKPLFQKVLVAYNGSKSSLHAVLYAILMAKLYRCSVKVVCVVDVSSIKQLTISKFMVSEEAELLSANLESDGKKKLDYVTEIAKTKSVKIETQLCYGSVWSEIIKAADDYKADVILLGGIDDNLDTHYSVRNVISRQDSEIIGSAHCSVLVIREPYIEQKFKLV